MSAHFSGNAWVFPGTDRRLLKVQFSFLLMVRKRSMNHTFKAVS
ncbi:hypothetical protein [Pseudomonas umsongensis]|nr:hypothetical protein [Pseudomonas umsongensis]